MEMIDARRQADAQMSIQRPHLNHGQREDRQSTFTFRFETQGVFPRGVPFLAFAPGLAGAFEYAEVL